MIVPSHSQKYFWRVLYIGVLVGIIMIFLENWGFDDPYITYRYAKNLAGGLGFVYNTGERLLSTTTPLFTLLLASLSILDADLPATANLIGALSLAIASLCLYDLENQWSANSAGRLSLLLFPTFPLLLSTIGSEIPLFLAFGLRAFVLYTHHKYSWAAACAALAALIRPDGLILAVLLTVDYLIHSRLSIPWKALGIFIAITLPWFCFAWIYFGSPIPATLAAKQAQGMMPVSQRFLTGLFYELRTYHQIWPAFWFSVPFALAGIIYAARTARHWCLLFTWAILHSAIYSLLGVSHYFWYYAPLATVYITAIVLGIMAFQHWWRQTQYKLTGLPAWLERTYSLLPWLLVFTLISGQISALHYITTHPDPRIPIYRAAGQWLYANTPATARVATLEVGIIGYYANRYMIDFAGLLQPETTKQLRSRATYQDIAKWASKRYHPGYIVLYEGWSIELELDYLSQNCQLVKSFLENGYPYKLNIYSCSPSQ